MNILSLKENERFGRLVVVKNLNKTNGRHRNLWLFKCDCGNEVEVSATAAKTGRKRSCGCLQKEHKENCGKRLAYINLKPNKEGPINKLYGSYKRQSVRRGYEWKLSKEDFTTFLSKKCFYCGNEPKSKYTTCSKHPVNENILVYNGIDRKENNTGYTKENCITACGICNRMKMNLNYYDFIEQIKKIYNTQRL